MESIATGPLSRMGSCGQEIQANVQWAKRQVLVQRHILGLLDEAGSRGSSNTRYQKTRTVRRCFSGPQKGPAERCHIKKTQNLRAERNCPRKTFKSIRKTRKKIRKTIRNATEICLAPLRPLKNISPALFNKF